MRKQQTKGQQASRSQDASKDASQHSQKNVHGEGNYAASKQYNDATRDFVKSGRVDKAAQDAAPKSDADAYACICVEESRLNRSRAATKSRKCR